MKTFRKGGIHPQQNKITADCPIEAMPLPMEVVLPLSQNIGAPAIPVVKKGDKVKRGDLVANAGGFVSASIHAPISGTVTKTDKVTGSNGYPVDAITISADVEDHADDTNAPTTSPRTDEEVDSLDAKAIVEMIAAAGIVGLGGATFPTRVKLSPPEGMTPMEVIINGAECEPWLTNDDRLMREEAAAIIDGTLLLMRAVNVNKAYIGIENNKPQAIASMREAAGNHPSVEVVSLKTKYPQGGEKQLIKAITGREVPSGALPVSVGAIVQNVATAYAVHKAVRYGSPLIDRVVTVTGPDVKRPGNYRVTLGTSVKEVIEFAGGLPENTGKIIMGGPMMGRTAVTIDTPMTKGASAILLLPEGMSERGTTQPCIRCARCVDACPMGLEPYLISTLARLERYDDAKSESIMDCIECGSCSYICPSWRPLLDYIRLGKLKIRSKK